MASTILDQMAAHLEFMGYELTRENDRVRAIHRRHLNINLRDFRGGILLTSLFGCSTQAKSNRLGYLNLVNSLNHAASVVRVYADDDSDLVIEAWHPASYDRAKFGEFLELWNADGDRLLQAPEIGNFLR